MREVQVQDREGRQLRIAALAAEIRRELRALGLPDDRAGIEFGDGVLTIARLQHVPSCASVLLMRDLERRGRRHCVLAGDSGVVLYAVDLDAAREAAARLLYGEAQET